MAKGADSKKIVWNKMLEVFPGAFMADEKTLRIPMTENGEPLEIKVALTAAKDILGGADNVSTAVEPSTFGETAATPAPEIVVEPTAEEKANVQKLLDEFNF